MLFFVSSSINSVKCTSERIWREDQEIIFSWEFSIHSILGEEPLESVDEFINSFLEDFIFFLEEFLHFLFLLSGPLDERLLLFSDVFVSVSSLQDDVLLECEEFLLEEIGPPFTDYNEIIKEHVLSVVELVVCFLFVAVKNLNERSG